MKKRENAYLSPECRIVMIAAGSSVLQGSPIVGSNGLQDGNPVLGEDLGFDSWD